MFIRRWRAVADDMAGYLGHFRRHVLPALRHLKGFRGALVLRRDTDGSVEIEVLTLWDSMSAIRQFAGDHAERAVVEPEAAAVLRRFDRRVRHFEVALDAALDAAFDPASTRQRTSRRRRPKRNRTRPR